MKISVNTIQSVNKRYGCADDIAPHGVDALAEKIGAQLGAIEEIIDFGSKFQGIIIARVVSCAKHPGADRLNVCLIDDGGMAKDVDRDANGHVQVVCGAPNVREGLTVAWLPPGSTVPESVGKDPFVLGSRELRGVVSNGMLASPRELALGDSHEGILEIDEDIAPGTDFAEHFGLAGEYVLDIENKMFTHRPDCFGFLGVARELAGIQQVPFKSPEWYRADAALPEPEADNLELEVRNEVSKQVPRFSAIVMSDIAVKPSPVWLQIELAKAGLRPINNIVDMTNFFMLKTGQPLHAYDYDKVKALDGAEKATIVIRHPQPGEKIKLLNGKEIAPRAEAIMIASDSKLIGIGGVMGGADTEVDDSTKKIIIEVANFDMYSIRRTSMAHGLFTDAVTRFNKGQSPLQTRAVLAKMVDEVRKLAGGKVAGPLVDSVHLPHEMVGRNAVHLPVHVSVGFINVRLGLKLTVEDISRLLTNVEFDVRADGDDLTITAPFWRTDIEIPEDIVEEVGRLYGFDHLPLELPRRSIAPARKDDLLELKRQVRAVLSKAGANEVLTYSFVHGKLLEKAGQDPADAFQLSNALSPDLQYYRLSLTPSLLDKIHPNIKAGHDQFALFEIGKGHNLKHTDDDGGLPGEFEMLSLVYAASDKVKLAGAPFYQAKRHLEALAAAFGLGLTYAPVDPTTDYPVTRPYDLSRSAMVLDKVSGTFLGMVGELRPEVLRNFKLPRQTAVFDISLRDLLAASQAGGQAASYVPLPRFPKIEQDICLRVAADLPYQHLYDFVDAELRKAAPADSYWKLLPVDIYQRPDEAERKQITLRLSIAHYDKTLRDSEVAGLLDGVAAAALDVFHAERV